MNIIFVGVTTFQERTWGRVFVQYEKNNELFFAFKNWMKFEENTYFGKGKLEDERAYNWFLSENINIFKNSKDVLNGAADDLFLTPVEYKEKYGTPSVILKRLLIEIRANDYQKVENRRGWYNRSQLEEIVVSPIRIKVRARIIEFTEYQAKIVFPPREFLIYLFYLRHPEGIFRYQIEDFEEEIKEIYEKVTKSLDVDKIKETVKNLILIDGNSWDEQVSRVKKLLVKELGERVAEKYTIHGRKNEKYFIPIDRELVEIE